MSTYYVAGFGLSTMLWIKYNMYTYLILYI